jgi:protein-disulfide isomerase
VAAVLLTGAAFGQMKVHPGKLKGSQTAAVVVEIFSDFQCPACRNLHEQVERQMVQDFAEPGKILVVYRDFPLPMHPYARPAARLANAAARMGKYSQVADALFSAQSTWSANGDVVKAATMWMTPADSKKLQALAAGADIEADIERDISMGKQVPVMQTPTLVIRHQGRSYPLAGIANYSLLKRFLEQLLSK